ncbi:histidinol-phosphatase (PHP family) [Hathewaya proteolytica DSM 3090]|uniref:Histidinol-phosphatase n=1 Tax=Hathewaya proteolytica DSM 3090 TaxID=1121331 RepID=A0A1M6P6N9_9CLOT|nr:histidinol-phosphatase HisJ family protein [Hathewaya proteolytica]SHK03631.1 histidinol-phosphatase (PHP family) [Hathewaya proteolytica DSM 3090]
MFDNHIHTEISADSSMLLSEAIKAAENKNLSLCLTEHIDLAYHNQKLGQGFTFDILEYKKKYGKSRNDKLLLGVELGMRPDMFEDNVKIMENQDMDFIIGSIHYAQGVDVYSENFYQGKTKEEAYGLYLKDMITCVEMYNDFDSLGHIDYVARYSNYADAEIHYDEFKDQIDTVLELIIGKHKVMEINTRRLHMKGVKENFMKIYGRYKELGGMYVTVGSDAHSIENIGMNFDIARLMVRELGLVPVYFKDRKMIVDEI